MIQLRKDWLNLSDGWARIFFVQIVAKFCRRKCPLRVNPDGFQGIGRTGIRQAASGRLPRFDQMHTLNRYMAENRPSRRCSLIESVFP